jgi:hypothetical protein
MTQQDIPIEVTADDIQSVMKTNPMVTLQVQNQALMRKLGEAHGEITRLTQELEQAQNGKNKKGG